MTSIPQTGLASDRDRAGRTGPGGARVPRYAWQSLYVGLVATYLGLVLTLAFFAVGGLFAPVSDLTTVVLALAFAPVAWTLHRIVRPRAPRASVAVLSVAAIGIAVTIVGAVGLVVRDLGLATLVSSPLAIQFAGLGIVGAWLVGIGLLGWRTDAVNRRLSAVAVVTGLGYASFPVLTATVGNHPLVYAGTLVGLLGFTVWALLLARAFRSGAVGVSTPEA